MKATVIAIGFVLALSVSAIPAGAQLDQERVQQPPALEQMFRAQERAAQRMLDAMNEEILAKIDEASRVRFQFFVREIEKFGDYILKWRNALTKPPLSRKIYP